MVDQGWQIKPVWEMALYLALPAAQGCAAEIADGKSLISKPGENRRSERRESQDGLIQCFLGSREKSQRPAPPGNRWRGSESMKAARDSG
jgi:hypothetical protein